MTDQTKTQPVCKFEEGCHRVVPCETGCGASVDWAVVAYRSPGTRTLYCVVCARQESGWQPLTADKVREGAVCDFCGGRVLAVASRTLGDVVARYAPSALLTVLPPADRATVLREAADAAAEQLQRNPWTTAADVIAELRRMAAEAQQPEARDNQGGALIEDYLRFLRGQGPEPDLSELPPEHREAIAGQFEIVRALADRDPLLPPLDRDPVARRLGLYPPAVGAQQPKEARP